LVALLGTTDAKDGLEGVPDPSTLPSTRLQAVAAGGTPCDFRPIRADVDGLAFWLGGTRGAMPEQYRLASPEAFVTPDDPPMFLFHGEQDELVPRLSPERMHNTLTAAGVESELYIVSGAGHIGACMDHEAISRAIAFLDRHLKTTAAVTK
jgi:pimeloyl-ACP methyl ester carboxylesterase